MPTPATIRRRNLIVPREHGAWGILLVPLVTGAFKGGFDGGSPLKIVPVALAAVACFWLRTPVESWLGTGPMRAKSAAELRLVKTATVLLAVISFGSLIWLLGQGTGLPLIWIGGSAVLCFGIQAVVKQFSPTSRTISQIIGAAGLTATAPAAYCAVASRTDTAAWMLWIGNFLFAANQIHYVHVRVRTAGSSSRREKFEVGRWFLLGQLGLAAILMGAWAGGLVHTTWPLAFMPLLLRGFGWFLAKPRPLLIHAVGKSELVQACIFAGLLAISSWHQ